MIVEIINPETKQKVNVEIDNQDAEKLKEELKPVSDFRNLTNMIDNLSVPAEVKVLLSELTKLSIKVGSAVLQVGQKILELVLFIIKTFPNTAAGMVVGATLGLIISGIPVIGFLLGWLLLPLCTALGLALGFWKDLDNKELNEMISKGLNSIFGTLKNVSIKAAMTAI